MGDWIHALPLSWMAILIFSGTFLSAAAIYFVVQSLAVGDRLRAFKSVSPGLLSPLGIIFGLIVARCKRGTTSTERMPRSTGKPVRLEPW